MERDEFLQRAISCPNATRGAHQGRFDLRIGGKSFATCDPKPNLGARSLLPEQQADLIARSTAIFAANGAWDARGWTKISLPAARCQDVQDRLMVAWGKVAPKSLVQGHKSG